MLPNQISISSSPNQIKPCCLMSRKSADGGDEDDGMGFKLAGPREEEDDFTCEPVLPKIQQKKPMAIGNQTLQLV